MPSPDKQTPAERFEVWRSGTAEDTFVQVRKHGEERPFAVCTSDMNADRVANALNSTNEEGMPI